jgi:hypothetical protein
MTWPCSRSSWPRSAGISCRCRRLTNGPRQLPGLPRPARLSEPSRPRVLLPGRRRVVSRRPRRHHRSRPYHHLVTARTRPRCPVWPQASLAWSWSTSTSTAASSRPAWSAAFCRASTWPTSPSRGACGTTRHGSATDATPWPRWRGCVATPGPGRPTRASSYHRCDSLRRRASVVPGTCARATPGPQRPPRAVRACLASRHQSRLVLRLAPGAATTAGAYRVRGGDPVRPGRMPTWLARKVMRATTAAPAPARHLATAA